MLRDIIAGVPDVCILFLEERNNGGKKKKKIKK
jgi:hypothetical protein